MGEYGGIFKYIVPLVIVISVMVVGLLAFNKINEAKTFEKRYMMEDLKFLKHSMMAAGGSGDIVMSYTGIEDSDITIRFDRDRIATQKVNEDALNPVNLVLPGQAFTYLVDDAFINSGQELVAPQSVGGQGAAKFTPHFFIGIKSKSFFVSNPPAQS